MARVKFEFETQYHKGDVVIFNKNGLQVGIIEGFYYDDDTFWFNIRTSKTMVYTYTNQGDIGEYNILGKIDGVLKDSCLKQILG